MARRERSLAAPEMRPRNLRTVRHMARRLLLVLLCLGSSYASGCSDSGAGRPRASAVSGRVVTLWPGRSIRAAMLSLRSGDTLLLHGGDYFENVDVSVAAGSASARITMTNVPGERPVVHGRFWVHGQSYWTFDGINVVWPARGLSSKNHLVGLINGVGWVWKNSEVWGAHSFAGVLVAGTVPGQPADWTFSHSCVHDTYPSNGTNQDQNLYVNTGLTAGAGLVSHNLFYNATNGMGIKLGGSDVHSGGAAHVTVDHNTIYNSAQNLMVSWDSHDNRVTNNVFARTGSGYANVRGYQLVGARNTAAANTWWGGIRFLMNDPGYAGVVDQGNEIQANPQFDSTASCSGFHIANPDLVDQGR